MERHRHKGCGKLWNSRYCSLSASRMSKTYRKLRFDHVLHLDVQVLDFHLHAFSSLHCRCVRELGLLQLREKLGDILSWHCVYFRKPNNELDKHKKAFKRMAHLIFELGNLPLARGVALQVVQHNLRICQEDFGPLQIFLQPLLSLHIPLANLNDTPASLDLFQDRWHMWALESSSQSAFQSSHTSTAFTWMQACAQRLYGRKTEQRKNLVLDVQHFALQLSSLAQHFLLVFVLLLQLHLHLFQLQDVCRRSANAIGDTLSQTNHITNLPVWPCCETALAFSPAHEEFRKISQWIQYTQEQKQ